MKIWSKLYNTLSPEEKNILYFSMKDTDYGTNHPVFLQGDLNPNLYFINHGHLKVTYKHKDGEALLKKLGPGELAGQDNFFLIAVCKTSLITLTNVNLKYLGKVFFLNQNGIIVGVYPHPFEDYSIHVKFVRCWMKK